MDDLRRAVEIELAGPGKQRGYRAMRNKIQQLYELSVPRSLLYDVIYHLDPKDWKNKDWKNKLLVEKEGEKLILSRKDLTRYIP